VTKMITVNIEKCTGCGACEMMCSFRHHGEFNPRKARIKKTVFHDEQVAVPILCQQCEDAWCVNVCPSGALSKGVDMLTGAPVVTVSEDVCVGCRMCMLACPYGNIVVGSKGVAEKCNLCDGDPQCVKFCAFGALRFEDTDAAIRDRKAKLATTLITAYREGS
jgi:carbon-monoxide dehydrogenase iron sulfur subunit